MVIKLVNIKFCKHSAPIIVSVYFHCIFRNENQPLSLINTTAYDQYQDLQLATDEYINLLLLDAFTEPKSAYITK